MRAQAWVLLQRPEVEEQVIFSTNVAPGISQTDAVNVGQMSSVTAGLQSQKEALVAKMTRRHPHVFGDAKADDADTVLRNWEALKQEERRASGKAEKASSMLDGVSKGLPGVMEAFQMTTKVSRVGFDWKVADDALVKLDEEVAELREAIAAADAPAKVAEEVGDLLFIAVNVARLAGVDPESALKAANRKFRRRFRHVERRMAESGQPMPGSALEVMDGYWEEAKALERKAGA